MPLGGKLRVFVLLLLILKTDVVSSFLTTLSGYKVDVGEAGYTLKSLMQQSSSSESCSRLAYQKTLRVYGT